MAIKPKWSITVMSADSQDILFHALCEDFKEVQCLATEARSFRLDLPIWIRRPGSQECFSWD